MNRGLEQFLQYKSGRSAGPGIITPYVHLKLCRSGQAWHNMFIYGLVHRFEYKLARANALTADDNSLGVKDVDQIGDSLTQHAAGTVIDRPRGLIAGLCQGLQLIYALDGVR